MMQQTTYKAVLPYYRRFIGEFPTVESLAAADEADVLKAWEGLGYYARARNLLEAAKIITRTSRTKWPRTSAEWAALPGIGPYTAAALSSVLDGERTPVVDGNVVRVFSRVWKLTDDFSGQPNRAKLAERLQPEIARCRVPGDFNQAMMELGATVCTPANPACGECPLAKVCVAHREGSWSEYPVKRKKGALPVRETTSVVVKDEAGRVLLVQNREGGLLKGLWELPTIRQVADVTQVFSHFRLEQKNFVTVRTDAEFRDPKSVPLTTATRKALSLSD